MDGQRRRQPRRQAVLHGRRTDGARAMGPATAPGATSKKMDSGGASATGPSAQPPFRVEMKEATRRPRRTLGGRAEHTDGNHVATMTRAVPLDLPDLGGGTTRGRRARCGRRRISNRTRPVRRRMSVPAWTIPPAPSVILNVGIYQYFFTDTYVYLLIYLQLSRQKYLHIVTRYF